MQRPLKFRGWNTVRKTMQMNSQIVLKVLASAFTADIAEGRFIPEQFTGLFDCDGKEIYEGDIVTFLDADSRTSVVQRVVFRNGMFQTASGPLYGLVVRCGCRILGNIHQHPELLEVRS
jgi:hypothetical protein